MDNHGIHPNLPQQDHVPGEAGHLGVIPHGVAAEFHHNNGVVEALQIGKRLRKSAGGGKVVAGHLCFHGFGPVRSVYPAIRAGCVGVKGRIGGAAPRLRRPPEFFGQDERAGALCLRRHSKVAMVARSVGMPSPFSDEVRMISG